MERIALPEHDTRHKIRSRGARRDGQIFDAAAVSPRAITSLGLVRRTRVVKKSTKLYKSTLTKALGRSGLGRHVG